MSLELSTLGIVVTTWLILSREQFAQICMIEVSNQMVMVTATKQFWRTSILYLQVLPQVLPNLSLARVSPFFGLILELGSKFAATKGKFPLKVNIGISLTMELSNSEKGVCDFRILQIRDDLIHRVKISYIPPKVVVISCVYVWGNN